jgi:type IV secretion system protein VirD4
MSQPESSPNGIWLGLAGFAAALALLWLTGALAGALFGAGWSAAGAAQMIAVAIRLPNHLGDPRLAWPAPVRGAMPGGVGFYVTLALILGALGATVAVIAKTIDAKPWRGLLGGKRAGPPSARWASKRDLRALFVSGPERGRLILGRAYGRLLAAERRQSVIVFAPTETHKTVGLAIPVLLEWDGPVIATSIKTDLVRDTLAARGEVGEAMVFDPTRVTGLQRTQATPLSSCGSWRGAMRVAHWLTRATQTASAGIENADFWYATAEKLLAPLLFAAAASGASMADVVGWLEEGERAKEEVSEALEQAGVPEAHRAWVASWEREERQRSSIRTTAETIVGAFSDPLVAKETSEAQYTPARLLDGRANTLYLCAPTHEQERLRPLFSMMIQELLAVVYESAAATGKPIDPPLLLLLDEAANIAPIPNLDEVASTGAGQGVQLLSVFQDLAQLRTRYGGRAQTILNNHRAKLFGRGVSDPETLDYVAKVTGAAEFQQRSRTAGERGQTSTTEASTYRDLAPANVIREAEPESALLIYSHLPPTYVQLRPFYQESTLNRSGRDQALRGNALKESAI